MNITEYKNNLKKLRSQILDETKRIVYAKENEIISLNIVNIEQGKGSDENILKNINKRYSGTYTLGTNLLDPSKKAGSLYNFFKTGDFLGNFKVDVLSNLTQITIYSTGTGSGDKAEFFKGYKNLYGLDKQDQNKLNYELIYPDLMKFINQYI